LRIKSSVPIERPGSLGLPATDTAPKSNEGPSETRLILARVQRRMQLQKLTTEPSAQFNWQRFTGAQRLGGQPQQITSGLIGAWRRLSILKQPGECRFSLCVRQPSHDECTR
jgi:hypothetical protein